MPKQYGHKRDDSNIKATMQNNLLIFYTLRNVISIQWNTDYTLITGIVLSLAMILNPKSHK